MLSVSSSTVVPAPDSLAQMLVQALTAQDHALLEEVRGGQGESCVSFSVQVFVQF